MLGVRCSKRLYCFLVALNFPAFAFGAGTHSHKPLAVAQRKEYAYVAVVSQADKFTAFIYQYPVLPNGSLGSVPLSEAVAPKGGKYVFVAPGSGLLFIGNGGYDLWAYRIGSDGHLSNPTIKYEGGTWDHRLYPNLLFAPTENVAYSTIGDVYSYRLSPDGSLKPIQPFSLIAQLPPRPEQSIKDMVLDSTGRYSYAMTFVPGNPVPGGALVQSRVLPNGAIKPLNPPMSPQTGATFEYPHALCIAPNGQTVYAAHEYGISVYHVKPDHTLQYLQQQHNEVEASEAGQNNSLVTTSHSGKYLYSLAYTGYQIFRTPILADGRLGSSSSLLLHDNGTIVVSKLNQPKEGMQHMGEIDNWYFTPDGRSAYLLDNYDHKVFSYDVRDNAWGLTGQVLTQNYYPLSIAIVRL